MRHDPQSFDQFAEQYDFVTSLGSCHSDFFLKNLPAERRRILDVGCGTGHLAFQLAQHFESVLAIDLSEPMLEIARRKRAAPNIEYRRADANKLRLDVAFDFIVSRTTFHHLRDIPATLQTLKSLLTPEGKIVIVDNICPTRTIPWHVLAFSPILDFWLDYSRYGLAQSLRLLQFRYSRSWMAHLASDVYFTEADFRKTYGEALPGAQFTNMQIFVGVSWDRATLSSIAIENQES